MVGPGGSTTLTLTLDAAAAGWYGGEVSFGNNDSNENPFNFWLDGYVNEPPTIAVADDAFGGDFPFDELEWAGQVEVTLELSHPDGNSHTVEYFA